MTRKRGPYRSVLIPHTEEIAQWIEENKSFSEMQELLREKYDITINASSIWNFVKVRSKPPKKRLNIHPVYLQEIPGTKDVTAVSGTKENLSERTTKK